MCCGTKACPSASPAISSPRACFDACGTRSASPLLHRLDPETAHGLSLRALQWGLAPLPGPVTSPRLATTLAGLGPANPIGLAAGYDKNAVAIAPLSRAGFGFIEVGAATPRPQPGNPRPRLFRLTEDRAAINRFGFNNQGVEAIAARLAARPRDRRPRRPQPRRQQGQRRPRRRISPRVFARCGPHVDFATVNVSSPNTEKLRDLQGRAALTALLTRVMETRAALPRPIPIFLKIAPDLTDARPRRNRRGGPRHRHLRHHRHQHHPRPRRPAPTRSAARPAASPARPCSRNPPAPSPACRN